MSRPPATITVTSDADGAPNANLPITLREALTAIHAAWFDANTALGANLVTNGVTATKGANTIKFAIPGLGVHRITLAAAQGNLPALVGPVVIDGYSQKSPVPGAGGKMEGDAKVNTSITGFNGEIRIEIDGGGLKIQDGVLGKGFVMEDFIGANMNVDAQITAIPRGLIRGLSVFGFNQSAFNLTNAGRRDSAEQTAPFQISGNLIGLAADGTAAAKNGSGILAGRAEAVIGGYTLADRNVISNSVTVP